jgi:membrane protease YdiL (CAAX protease family)
MMDGTASQIGMSATGFSDWASLAITVFLLLAGAWEMGRCPHWRPVWKRVVLMYGALFVGLTLLAAGGVCGGALLEGEGGGDGRRQMMRLLTVGLSQALTGAVLLAAALCVRSGEARRRLCISRLLPVVDRWLSRATLSRKSPWGRQTLEWLLWLAGILAFSASWMWLAVHIAGAGVGQEVLDALAPKEGTSRMAQVVVTLTLVCLAPLVEEVIFRGFTQGWVTVLWPERWGGRWAGRTIGIVLSALLWALCHGGQIDPVWVKWVQIFGLGLALGVVRLRQGLEACVLLHLVFNLIGGFYLPSEFTGG